MHHAPMERRPFYPLKSQWAAAKAKSLWEAAREVERKPVLGGNYGAKQRNLAQLRRDATYWDGRAARYREDEAKAPMRAA